jgi:hypothetical protein
MYVVQNENFQVKVSIIMCIGIVGENLVAPQASPQKFTGEDHLKFLTNTQE